MSQGSHISSDQNGFTKIFIATRKPKARFTGTCSVSATARSGMGTYSCRSHLLNRIPIEHRPAVVERRTRLSDWEVDTMIGKGHQQALVSLTDRKFRFSLIAKVTRRCADTVAIAVLTLLKPLGFPLRTVASDNGKESAHHKTIAQAIKVRFFFAHPYADWLRRLNENRKDLIRQYFPKHRPFPTITQEEIQRVMLKLNNRPEKLLGSKPQIKCVLHSSIC